MLWSCITTIVALVTVVVFSGASPTQNHDHQGLHAVRRAPIWKTMDIPGPPMFDYIVNGKMVSLNEVCKGVEDGSLVWQNPNDASSKCPASGTEAIGTITATGNEVIGTTIATFTITELPASQPSVVIDQKQDVNTVPVPSLSSVAVEQKQDVKATPAPSLASVAVQQKQDVSTNPVQSTQAPELPAEPVSSMPARSSTTVPELPAEPVSSMPAQSTTSAPELSAESISSTPAQSPTATSSDPALVSTSSAAEPSLVESSSSQSGSISEGQGLELEFPDGTIDCSTFPSQYGPIDIEWVQHGGWSGIQDIKVEGDWVTYIKTEKPGDSDYKGCSPGAMCSYACPPGYQKSQWPPTQGIRGETVGGLECKSDGKLYLTNPGLSKTLCIKGTGEVHVQNKLSSNVAICRTDYPGIEKMVVPLNTQPESISPLTCPDANEYYYWKGAQTSAQYYINNQGVAVENACTWSYDGSNRGNWAPTTLGVGRDPHGRTWLGISTTTQNKPVSSTALNYTITVEGHVGNKCRYSNEMYCIGDNYEDCNPVNCVSEILSGQGTYVLSD